MRLKLATIVIGLLVAAGGTLAACSSSDPVPDEGAVDPVEYSSMEEDQDYEEQQPAEEQEAFEQPGQQPPEQQAGSPPEATGPVATIDGEEVPADEFNQHMQMVLQQSGGQLPAEMFDDIRDQILEQLVQEQLLMNAIESADIEVSSEEVDERIREYRAEVEESPFAEDMSFDDLLAQQGLSMDEFHELIEQEVAMMKLFEAEVTEMPDDDDVRTFYDDNRDRFTVPESVEARHLLVAVMPGDDDAWDEAEEKARAIEEELAEDDADLESIAEAHGEEVVFQEGPIHRSADMEMEDEMGQQFQQPQELEDAAFGLEDGAISEPIRIEHGWLIIERVEHQEERVEEFDEVAEQLKDELRHQAMGESIEPYLAKLEGDAEVELHPENIQ